MGPLLEKFPALLRTAEKLAVGLQERAAGTAVGKLQAARKAAAAGTVEAGYGDRAGKNYLLEVEIIISQFTFTPLDQLD